MQHNTNVTEQTPRARLAVAGKFQHRSEDSILLETTVKADSAIGQGLLNYDISRKISGAKPAVVKSHVAILIPGSTAKYMRQDEMSKTVDEIAQEVYEQISAR
jgi:hypothetical protein